MKDGMRFVDCDMHIMEPVDLFDRYLDREFRDRVSPPVGADGKRKRGVILVDGQPTTYDVEIQQHRKPHRGIVKTETSQPLSGSRIAAVPITIRSTPAPTSASAASSVRTPPPLCTGMPTPAAMAAIASRFVASPDRAASRSTTWSHSAPARSKALACATGSSAYTVSLP